MADPKQQSSYVGQPTSIPGKPILESLPTPNLDDRILVLRKDLRKFKKLPRKGSRYTGPNAEEFKHFRFATAKASDQLGWVNFYYINTRRNQDDYNFEVSYPYASKDFPTFTRTYVYLRGDQRAKEPDADTKDPVYPDLSLTDHKVIRLQQPELDALFVGIQRVYERLPGPVITSHKMNEPQQDVTITEQEDIAPSFPIIDAFTELATLERKTTAKAKVTFGSVPEVFPATDYRFGGEDPINPYRFRRFGVRVPALVTAQTQAGTAVAVTSFGPDEWGHDEQQVTKYKKRVTSNIRSSAGLPVTIIQQKLTPEQQVATDTETYANSIQTLIPSALMIEGEIDNLGNGQSIKHETTVPNVFPNARVEVSRPDPIPEKFRITIPTIDVAGTTIGQTTIPVLGTGEFQRTDEQTKEFWHRSSVRGRNLSVLPSSLVNYRMSEEHQLITIIETLDQGAIPSITIGPTTVEAKVENLGLVAAPSTYLSMKTVGTVPNIFPASKFEVSRPSGVWPERFRALVPDNTVTGMTGGTAVQPTLGTGDIQRTARQVKEGIQELGVTTRNTNYPTPWLYGQEYDASLDVPVPYQERVEAVGDTPIGTNRVDIVPQGDGTQRIKTADLASVQAALDNFIISFPSTGNLELPDVLQSVTGIIRQSSGQGNMFENGSAAFSNRGSATTDIQNSAEANAAIIPEVQIQISQIWARNIPITHYLFFLPIPVSIGDVLTRLTTLIGSPISPWPKWCPVSHNLTLTGGQADVQVKASAGCMVGGDGCNEDCVASQSSAKDGVGYSQKFGIVLKTVHIPPTIHGVINFGGEIASSATVTATTYAQVFPCVFPGVTSTDSLTVYGDVSPTTLPATPSDSAIPNSGLRLHKLDSEPYRWGYAKVHAEIVDFADLVLP